MNIKNNSCSICKSQTSKAVDGVNPFEEKDLSFEGYNLVIKVFGLNKDSFCSDKCLNIATLKQMINNYELENILFNETADLRSKDMQEKAKLLHQKAKQILAELETKS
ncbi:hypothetical protein [Alkalihalobacillus sp. 1P02AB]|uniref:hypothetical protein n=1 Tax=Alkalihalobacillus sp. 1P02AB TaxID=3132260 RepID=UPI0039A43D4D